jgi:hypothetical protein
MLKSVAILTSEEERIDVAVARVRARAIKQKSVRAGELESVIPYRVVSVGVLINQGLYQFNFFSDIELVLRSFICRPFLL